MITSACFTAMIAERDLHTVIVLSQQTGGTTGRQWPKLRGSYERPTPDLGTNRHLRALSGSGGAGTSLPTMREEVVMSMTWGKESERVRDRQKENAYQRFMQDWRTRQEKLLHRNDGQTDELDRLEARVTEEESGA